MYITRRSFLKYCASASAAIGLGPGEFLGLENALANPNAPSVLWLQGSGCTGCSISFLNYVSPTAPQTPADILISSINLLYHPNLSAVAGEAVAAIAEGALVKGGYILVVEGGVPTAFGGYACMPWSMNGTEVTFQSAVTSLAAKAMKIICVGNCAAWGGVSGSGNNPTAVRGVRAATGKATINVAGCPPHPDWLVWTIVQLLQGKTITLDSYGRPTYFYGRKIHDQCVLKETDETKYFGVPNRCLKELGCRGPETNGNCPTLRWNNGVNWCVGASAPCIGCTNPTFPGSSALNRQPS